MVIFLHTADWHMGAAYKGLGSLSESAREKRFKAAEKVVMIAKECDVDFVLIAGDLFDSEVVGNTVVRRVVKILNDFAPTPVYIISGNHDPYRPGSVWGRWSGLKEHIHLLTEAIEIEIDSGVSLYPSPLFQKEGNFDPTEWIPVRTDDKIRIGMAHGSLASVSDDPNFPICCKRCDLCGLDYLALGDWHGHNQIGRVAYSGSIEPLKFGDDRAGSVSIVTIRAPGELPIVERRACNVLRWASITATITNEADLRALEEQIGKFPEPANTVLSVDVKVTDGVERDIVNRLSDLKPELEGRCFSVRYSLDADPIARLDPANIPEGAIKQVDETLEAIACGRIPTNLNLSADAATAARAREILLKIAGREDI